MSLFLAKQLVYHPIINLQQIMSDGNILYPSQQNVGPSTSQTMTKNQNFIQQLETATILPQNKKI